MLSFVTVVQMYYGYSYLGQLIENESQLQEASGSKGLEGDVHYHAPDFLTTPSNTSSHKYC